MKNFIMAATSGALAGVIVTTQVAGPLLAQEEASKASVYEQLDLFGDIFERIRSQYVEEVDPGELIEAAIDGMLTSLDPHSSYLSPDDAAQMRIDTRGEFGGLGIEVTQEEGFVKVVSPMDGTPAYEAGVEAGDFITHVDGESILGMTLDEAVERMRGPVGSEIIITIVREGEQEPFDVTIVRDTIGLQVVRNRIVGDTVVLRVSTFNDKTTPKLEEMLGKGVEELGGMDAVSGFVLDMRNNPGGYLDQANSVSDALLNRGVDFQPNWAATVKMPSRTNGRGSLALGPEGDYYAIYQTSQAIEVPPETPPEDQPEPLLGLTFVRWSPQGEQRWLTTVLTDLTFSPDPPAVVVDEDGGIVVASIVDDRLRVERRTQRCTCP